MQNYPIIEVNVNEIRPSPKNKCTGIRRDVDELAKSIQQQGLLHEPIVREIIETNSYEIIVGERRVLAVSTFSETILVKNMGIVSDETAFEMTMTENLQRKDISCLEEAENIQEFIRMGYTPEKIAEKMGKSLQYISKRSKLTSLAKCFVDAYYDTKNKLEIHRWGPTHLEKIARFEPHIQQGIYDSLMDKFSTFMASPGTLTADELEEKLNEFLLKLSTAPWKLDDNKNFELACSNCQKRSSCQTSLFEITTDDMCLDKTCWNEKLRIHTLNKANDKSIEVIIDNNSGRSGIFDEADELKEKAIKGNNVVECKKTDAGARKALVIDGDGAGKVKYVKLSESAEKKLSGIPKTIEEKREGLNKKRRKEVCERFMNVLVKEQKEPFLITKLSDEGRIALAVIFGCRQLQNVVDEPENFDDLNMIKNYNLYLKRCNVETIMVDAARCALPVLYENLKYIRDSENVDMEKIEEFAKLIGFDLEECICQVQLDIKEPKSWKSDEPDPIDKWLQKDEEPVAPVETPSTEEETPIPEQPKLKKPAKKAVKKSKPGAKKKGKK